MGGMGIFPDGILGILLGLLFIIWAVLMFFAPFFWYGAWFRAKQVHLEAATIRKLLEEQKTRE